MVSVNTSVTFMIFLKDKRSESIAQFEKGKENGPQGQQKKSSSNKEDYAARKEADKKLRKTEK